MIPISAPEVLAFLVPDSKYVMTGNEFEGIEWLDGETITKEKFLAGFDLLKSHREKTTLDKAAAKASALAKLAALGLTDDEVKSIVG